MSVSLRPAGDRGSLVELPDNAAAVRLARLLREERPGLVDVVVGHTTVLVTWVGEAVDLGAFAERALGSEPEPVGGLVEIPVAYDGPDLDEVAQLTGLSPREVVARHTGAEHVAAFLGFQPGFAYLTGGDELLHVPAPRRSPHGRARWHRRDRRPVLGRVSAGLSGRLAAYRVDDRRPVRPAARAAGVARAGRPRQVRRGMTCVEVVSPGLLTTVQDRGRPGLAHLGVPPSGAAIRSRTSSATGSSGTRPARLRSRRRSTGRCFASTFRRRSP